MTMGWRKAGKPGRRALGLIAGAAMLTIGSAAHAEADDGDLEISLAYTVDAVAGMSGDIDRTVRVLDNLDLILDADLDGFVGTSGLTAHVYVLGNHGAQPNDEIGSLQGVDNIEVPESGIRLFEAWLQKAFGQGSILAGLYDLNSEFYVSESAGLLIAPPFGIGSELAATGPNGPSIFPSSGLALRLHVDLDATPSGSQSYIRMALVNAEASTLGDSAGIDVSFDEGVLAIAEMGTHASDAVSLKLGGWAYSDQRPRLYPSPMEDDSSASRSWGLYAAAEGQLWGQPGNGGAAFLRGGVSEDETTPYRHGAQAGILVEPAVLGREGSAIAIGLHHASTSKDFRMMSRELGDRPAAHETVIELTWAEPLTDFLTVQPDLQLLFNPGGMQRSTALVGILRVSLEL